MATAHIPYIAALEAMEAEQLRQSLSERGAEFAIEHNNWASDYPYTPAVTAHMAFDKRGIAILFNVSESHTKAVELMDNGRVWEDSCVEFFVSNPVGSGYFNFELNAIATLLAAQRTSREDATHFSADKLSQIVRHTSFDHAPVDICAMNSWWAVEYIPFSLLGLSAPPKELSANLYKCGDKLNQPHYLSWSPITLSKPNFHCPDFFGTLTFEDYE